MRQLVKGKTSLQLILDDVESELTSLHKFFSQLSPRGKRALKFYEGLAVLLRKEIARQAKLPTTRYKD
jgi:hypothetical protein